MSVLFKRIPNGELRRISRYDKCFCLGRMRQNRADVNEEFSTANTEAGIGFHEKDLVFRSRSEIDCTTRARPCTNLR